ncbi:MAG: hypothetical protein Kow00109_19080 [Acidobacteriota bacterium]
MFAGRKVAHSVLRGIEVGAGFPGFRPLCGLHPGLADVLAPSGLLSDRSRLEDIVLAPGMRKRQPRNPGTSEPRNGEATIFVRVRRRSSGETATQLSGGGAWRREKGGGGAPPGEGGSPAVAL